MLSFRLTANAQQDLIELRQYTLLNWGMQQSIDYLSALNASINQLCEFPEIGILRPNVGEGVRSFPAEQHVIYYLVKGAELIVFAVLHSKMVPTAHLKNRQLKQDDV